MRPETEIKAMLDRTDAQLIRFPDADDTEVLDAIRDTLIYVLFDYIDTDRVTQYFDED